MIQLVKSVLPAVVGQLPTRTPNPVEVVVHAGAGGMAAVAVYVTTKRTTETLAWSRGCPFPKVYPLAVEEA